MADKTGIVARRSDRRIAYGCRHSAHSDDKVIRTAARPAGAYLNLTTGLVTLFLVGCSSPAPTRITRALIARTATAPTLPIATVPIAPAATAPTAPMATVQIAPTVTVAIPTTATDQALTEETGVDELDRIIQIVLAGDMNMLRSLVRFTQARCTFEDGLGGPPKCEEGEVEGKRVDVLPFIGPEGHFVRKENIESWTGIDSSELYAVYAVSDSVFSDPDYPSGQYAIAFINEARFWITTLQVVEGFIVRVDNHFGSPPSIRPDDVDKYLIPPSELDR